MCARARVCVSGKRRTKEEGRQNEDAEKKRRKIMLNVRAVSPENVKTLEGIRCVPAVSVRKVSYDDQRGKKRSRSFTKSKGHTLREREEETKIGEVEDKKIRGNVSSDKMFSPLLLDINRCYIEYSSNEAALLNAKTIVPMRKAMQNLMKLFTLVPTLAAIIGKKRLVYLARAKRAENPEKWNVNVAKTFGKLMKTIDDSMKVCGGGSTPSTSQPIRLPMKKRRKKKTLTKEDKNAALQLLQLSPKMTALSTTARPCMTAI